MTRAVSRLFQSLIKYPCGRIELRKQNLIAMSKLAAKQNLISSRDCHSCFVFKNSGGTEKPSKRTFFLSSFRPQ